MTQSKPLEPERLRRRSNPAAFSFETTADIADGGESAGQARVLEAIEFGVGIRRDGYNLFVMGPTGIGKHSLASRLVREKAAKDPVPPDWCYVYNFETPHEPQAISLPPGRGVEFRDAMARLVEELQAAIPAAFESEEYQGRMQEIEEEFKERQEQAMEQLGKEAGEQKIKLVRTPAGFAFAPVRDGEVLGPDEFAKLPEDEQKRIREQVEALQERMQELMRGMAQWAKESREKVKGLNREFALGAVGQFIAELATRYSEQPKIVAYLDAVQADIVAEVGQVHIQRPEPTPDAMAAAMGATGEARSLDRYKVNLLVDNSGCDGAPVVTEDHPVYQNLIGRIEQKAQMGTLVTDFTLIKPGVLHRANGGYLLLDARKVLMQPFAWEALKMALQTGEIRIESLGQMLSLVSTVSLEPEHIPLAVKVVLLGERMIYYLLFQADPDFQKLFKVTADFEERIDRDDGNDDVYARLIAGITRQNELRPFDRGAVARVIDEAARMVDDAEKLTAHVGDLADLLRESDYWAGQLGHDVVVARDVEEAIDMKVRRIDRVRRRIREEILRETILIDTEGMRVAQINGLSVFDMGNFRFGQPNRITATARAGKGDVIDVERESKLGGPFHSKGVLILSSFLASRYGGDRPLSLTASLVFEQSYGRIDGDSASVAETCVLLSVLAGVPVKQSFAVTGSINQHGDVQAIGGVNEKIEGFFDVCNERGLTGEQGCIIPESNVKHLMLRADVVEAARQGRFRVHAVSTVDDAVELLTGMEAGKPDADGNYPEGSINWRVSKRLARLYELRRRLAAEEARALASKAEDEESE